MKKATIISAGIIGVAAVVLAVLFFCRKKKNQSVESAE